MWLSEFPVPLFLRGAEFTAIRHVDGYNITQNRGTSDTRCQALALSHRHSPEAANDARLIFVSLLTDFFFQTLFLAFYFLPSSFWMFLIRISSHSECLAGSVRSLSLFLYYYLYLYIHMYVCMYARIQLHLYYIQRAIALLWKHWNGLRLKLKM